MRRISAFDHVTLDGVTPAPGRPDEDCRDDFRHGGWSPPYGDEVMAEYIAAADALERLEQEPGTTPTGVIMATYASA